MSLKELRKQKHLSQAELAKKVGVTQVSISKYESGDRCPDLLTAKKLADSLGVSLNNLFLHLNIAKRNSH